ncbi:MAG: hypothetical protein IIC75_00235 [Bacteroidetes bacterium]|nr:hypothetical protein [Bacteroidota bacterium]
MKKLVLSIFVAMFIFSFTNDINAKTKFKISGGVYFHSELQSYGNWYKLNGGIKVWRPANVRSNWQPYRYGRWFWTEDGWYWDSDEDFGFITYHYGRWYFDDYYGWVWVPGNRWAPAWVDWKYDNDYIGWAPLSPYAEFSISIGIHFSNNFHYGYSYWNFVKYRNFCSPYVNNYFVESKYKYRIYSRTKYRNNYSYYRGRIVNRGVDIKYVEKRSGGRIVTRKIKRVNTVKDINKRYRNNNYVKSYVYTRPKVKTRTYKKDRTFIARDRKTFRKEIKPRTRINRNERNKVYRNNNSNKQKRIEKRTTTSPVIKSRAKKNNRKTIIKRKNPTKNRVNKSRAR